MIARKIVGLSLLLALGGSPAIAQLGAKDAAKLPPTDLDRIKVGQPAPDFTLENVDGRKVSLSDYHGKQNVVLVFYRGHW